MGTLKENHKEALKADILELKKELGPEVMILGHHYQRHGIVEVADKIGDSFGLAKAAAEATNVKKIVFCGVRFMAESAAILCRDDQEVYHPEPEAGCPMADMAPMEAVLEAWQKIKARPDYKGRNIIPVTYMNSHAPLKAFTGKHDGAVCTSSNAKRVIEWALEKGDLILFFPDQHLGRNTGFEMGMKASEMKVWYPSKEDGGIDTLDGVKMLLWNGHCPVHMKFTKRDVNFVKDNFAGCKVAVHPECPKEVVDLADAVGSTTYLNDWVKTQPDRTMIFVATEVHLVERMRKENPQLRIELLARSLCPTMYMVNLEKLQKTLTDFPADKLVPMKDEMKKDAKLALERMLELA